jgi:hypothetical protein
LVVDFATDMVEVETHISWDTLVKPIAIFFIAGALRLLRNSHSEDRAGVAEVSAKSLHREQPLANLASLHGKASTPQKKQS